MANIKCPACGSAETVEIVYGMPDAEAFEAEKLGEVYLGGCCVSDNDPERICKRCGREFSR
ncbi:hypothetical protein [Dethiobacter alkaliphilus]|uniref:Zn-ribbon protein n=1 Tax=Dethiobacter alkaliphilus AHT 1 TaxID=555088 RepID=C0GKS6_DETAL|nr:hypothetical protein [Dethiobacter alkaliphilus]EEG76045.1 Zn-ribbon protein [Dethiobacter alkaliphilus AHT 1]